MGRLFSKGTYHAEWGIGPEAKTWKSKSLDAVVRVVCETCNNGWMSDLDAEASATMSNMIRYGSAVSLLPIGIASIAMFAYKAAVVVNCAERGGRPILSPSRTETVLRGRPHPSQRHPSLAFDDPHQAPSWTLHGALRENQYGPL